jgi:RluA family pseudouridine synthase
VSEHTTVVRNVKVREGWAGLTVLDLVRRAFSEVSAREVFRKARAGEIRKNGERCDPLARLGCEDVVSVALQRQVQPARSIPSREHECAETSAGPLDIVREDEDLLAVCKPSGCASHPALGHSRDTLIERVHAYLGVSPGSSFRPGLANRLDLETSGIVLVVKTEPARRRLGRHSQRGLVRKHYITLVVGWPDPAEGEIHTPLARHADSRDRLRLSPCHPRLRGVLQEATTRFRTLEQVRQPLLSALLAVEILTGRTHQIRRHFTQLGHPLAGDARYGNAGFNADMRAVGELSRLFLHAHRVLVEHPRTGELLELVSPLPADLIRCLRAFGLSGSGWC